MQQTQSVYTPADADRLNRLSRQYGTKLVLDVLEATTNRTLSSTEALTLQTRCAALLVAHLVEAVGWHGGDADGILENIIDQVQVERMKMRTFRAGGGR